MMITATLAPAGWLAAGGRFAPFDLSSLVAVIVVGLIGIAIAFSAVAAFYWALKNGQMTNLSEGAESVFTDEEPIGQVTDLFPGLSEGEVQEPGNQGVEGYGN